MNKRLLLSLTIIFLSACSNKDLYNYGQNHQKHDCINNAQSEKQLAECHANKGKSFKDYDKDRKELTKKATPNNTDQ